MASVGAFGKIPALGDFFRLDLPNTFVEPWDKWLQTGIQSAREELADAWTNCFMSAPIWRFTVQSGLVGPTAMMGVLMPSVDRVGRAFPLTLALPIGNVEDIPLTHFHGTNVFEQMEQIALGSLEDDFTRDMLSERLMNVSPPVAPSAGRQRVNGTMMSLVSQSPMASLAASAVRDQNVASVWSAVLDDTSPMMMTSGLPNADQMRGLFDPNAPVWSVGTVTVQ